MHGLRCRGGKIDTDQVGRDYRTLISEHLEAAQVVLALIGPRFMAEGSDGRRRLDRPHDVLRLELTRALERNVPIIPVLVDGFIVTTAALVACQLRPELSDWLLFAHQSREPGHQRLLQALDANPLLDLSLRLGEGSGAAVAVPLLRSACALHNQMATFADANVSNQTE